MRRSKNHYTLEEAMKPFLDGTLDETPPEDLFMMMGPVLMMGSLMEDLKRGGFRCVYKEGNYSGWFRPRERDITKRSIISIPDETLLVEIDLVTLRLGHYDDLTPDEERRLMVAYAEAPSAAQRRGEALERHLSTQKSKWRPVLP